MKATSIIRWLLTAALIYGAYTETGIFTATCLMLCVIGIEGLSFINKEVLNV